MKNSPEGIATNILTDRLKLLEFEGILTKTVDPDNSKIYVYELTQKGLDLIPVILEISLWAAKYDPETAAPPHLVKKIKNDRASVIKAIIAAMKDPEKTIFQK